MEITNPMKHIYTITFLLLGTSMPSAYATDVSKQLLQEYKKAGVVTFSEQKGKALWTSTVKGRSCTSCHTNSVKNIGKHKKTGKVIKPMAPSINPKRLTDKKKVKKWLLRNCKWTFKRECTPQEKSDILAWLSQQ